MKKYLLSLLSIGLITTSSSVLLKPINVETTVSNSVKDGKDYLDLGIYNLGFDLYVSHATLNQFKTIWVENKTSPLSGASKFSDVISKFAYSSKLNPVNHKIANEQIAMEFFDSFTKIWHFSLSAPNGLIIHFATDKGTIFYSFTKPQ